MTNQSISVLLLAFNNLNTLDLNGPLEVLRNAALASNAFSITIAAANDPVLAAENVMIKPHKNLEEAKEMLKNFDVLIVPGGPHVVPNDKSYKEFLEVITAFATLQPRAGSAIDKRVILSICTGALFLGYAGVFDGLTATTHHLALGKLDDLCKGFVETHKSSAKGTKVIPISLQPADAIRYIEAQENEDGVCIISSGGISCGLDATLYLVSLLLGKDKAISVAHMMEYAWRQA